MKLSVAMADKNALPSAFVVFRGIEESIPLAASFGYDGIELALKRPDEVKPEHLAQQLADNRLEVSCISTGQVYADLGYSFSDEEAEQRTALIKMFKEFVDLSCNFGGMINIGRVRGSIGIRQKDKVEELFRQSMFELGQYAQKRNVKILIEPVNRYEIDFINSVEEGASFLRKVNLPNIKLMPDVFHMNIEDSSITGELSRNINDIEYVHLADSNRHAPGAGHTDFHSILSTLKEAGYNGWVSIEILPLPDPLTAARNAARNVLSLMRQISVHK